MKTIVNCVVVFLLGILFVTYPFQSAWAQTGGYIGIWGGYTIAPEASSDYDDDDGGCYDRCRRYYHDYDLDMEDAWALGVKVGYTHPQLKILAMEFEYSYLNPGIDRSVVDFYRPGYVTVEGEAKLNNFMFNVFAKYPHGVVHPYFGLGLGFSYIDISANAVSSDDTSSSIPVGDDYTSFAWQVLTGVEIDLAQTLSLDIGYRYFGTELELKDRVEFGYKNSRDFYYTTSMFTLGFKILF